MAVSILSIFHPLHLSASIVVSVVLYLIYYSHKSQLGHVPGPFLARFTDAWAGFWAWWYFDKDASYQRRASKQYGGVVRVGPRTVLVTDPEAIPLVMGLKLRLDKGPSYRAFLQGGVNASGLVAISDDHTHGRFRRPVANAYTLSSLKGYEPHVDEVIKKFVAVLDRHVDDGASINMSSWLHYWSYDVIGKLTFAKPIGFLEKGWDFNGLILTHRKFLR